ncbi:hypothetical protein H5410_039664, partial [Solanum commersonii]
KQKIKLRKVLKEAAMGDKTSFRIGNYTKSLLKNLLVVAFDQIAYSRCLEIHTHCYALITKNVDFSGEKKYMSGDYLKMMWRRTDFLRIVLQMGYNFIFTDADILWFRQPFAYFYSHVDFQIACDYYLHNSSDRITLQMEDLNSRTYPGKNEQDVLNIIKYSPFIKKIGLKMRFLDTSYFGGFCEPSKYINYVCTMHANCCIGLDNKIHDLRMAINDWKNYMALPNDERKSYKYTWTLPRICG